MILPWICFGVDGGFKVYDVEDEKDLEEIVKSTLGQIEEQRYEESILA